MNFLLKMTFFLACLLLTQACQKEITIDAPAYAGKPVIECLLLPGTAPKLYLSRSVPFFNSATTPSALFIPDAEVMLSTAGMQEVLRVDSVFDHFFCRWQPFYVGQALTQPNVTYQLIVKTGGVTYTASTTTDVPAVEVTEVSYTNSFRDAYGEHQAGLQRLADGQCQYPISL